MNIIARTFQRVTLTFSKVSYIFYEVELTFDEIAQTLNQVRHTFQMVTQTFGKVSAIFTTIVQTLSSIVRMFGMIARTLQVHHKWHRMIFGGHSGQHTAQKRRLTVYAINGTTITSPFGWVTSRKIELSLKSAIFASAPQLLQGPSAGTAPIGTK